MPTTHHDEARDYGFANHALALRERAGLTQHRLATLLGVSLRSIQTWEAGDSYPGAERLRQLIALYLERAVLKAGREEEEAAILWASARGKAARRLVPFDPHWFASLQRGGSLLEEAQPSPPRLDSARLPGRQDWGEAPDASICYGRIEEVATLTHWVLEGRCRLVGVLGMGGIGKTLLAARVAREIAPEFEVVYWRSLRNAPPVEEWLAEAIAAFSPGHALPSGGYASRLSLLMDLLRTQRGLLVLDNLETILMPGASAAQYRDGYAGYGEVLRRVGESIHQSCLLVTGREAPSELAPAAQEPAPIRTLRLGSLQLEAGRALLQKRGLTGDDTTWEALVAHYSGNPLALNVVGETISAVFGGDIATFLAQEAVVFGSIRQLLNEQVERLPALEHSVLNWLAVEREPVGFADLASDLGPEVGRGEVVEAVEGLQRRSLLERSDRGAFTLQPVVLEYATVQLVETFAREILAGEPAILVRQTLLKVHAKDYVRRSQERLIAQPLLGRLTAGIGTLKVVERLLALLERWRGQPAVQQGYGPGNVVNLLRLLRGDLRGLDLSRLLLRQTYLQGVEAQEASLANTHVSEVVFADVFNFPTSVAFGAGGAKLAVGTSTGEVYLWRVADRTLLLALQGHINAPPAMALSENERFLATSSFAGDVLLWDAENGQLLATLQGHAGLLWDMALSEDGQWVASGSVDGTVKLWDTARLGTATRQDTRSSEPNESQARLVATLPGHDGGVLAVALSGNGRFVASGTHDGTVRLWETLQGQLLLALEGHTGGIQSVALSREGQLLASGSHDGTVKLWETASGRLLATLEGHASAVRCVALSRDGLLVASSSVDGTVKLWSAPGGRLLATLQGHTSGVRGVALSKDGDVVASASFDGTVKLWEAIPVAAAATEDPALQTGGYPGRLLATLQGHTATVPGVAMSKDGRLLACGSQDGVVRLWDTSSGRHMTTLQGHAGTVWSVALSGDGRLLASGSYDGTVKLWATEGGRLLATLQEQAEPVNVNGVALSEDGLLVATGSEDGTLKLWDTGSGQHLATVQAHTGAVWSVALSRDGQLLASGSWDGTVKLWQIAPMVRAAIPGGESSQAGESEGQPLETLRGHTSGVWGVALSGDGRRLASGSYDGTVKLWATGGGALLATLQGHTGSVRGVALSDDGQLVASASYDGTAKLWDAESGRLVVTLQGHSSGVLDVALSGDGALVASGGWDGTVKLWDPHSGVCLQTLQSDRCYERMDITGLTGVTEAQRTVLRALGAIDQSSAATDSPIPFSTALQLPAPATVPAATAVVPARPHTPTNLPPARTSFVGRAAELAALTQALQSTTHTEARLLSVVGVVGSDKTRLALATAALVRDVFGDGIFLVDLASLPATIDPDPMPVAVVLRDALELQEQPDQELLDALVTFLRTRHLLLILDNCEHMVAACTTLIARLLRSCPELWIVTTSYQALGIAGESIQPVLPLAVPSSGGTTSSQALLERMVQSDAVQLFMQGALAVKPDFVLNEATAPNVTAICRQLDGLPRAILMAAAQLEVMGLEEVLSGLHDRFQLLDHGGRSGADRHQTLLAAMDWSYELLDPLVRTVLSRLSVFAGGWDVAAAEAVCAGGSVTAADVLEILDELLARSLVYVEQSSRVPRYGQLETMRQYGLQQLQRAGDVAAIRHRHLSWCAGLANQAASALEGADQAAWLARLAQDYDNLRAALQWALDCSLITPGLGIAVGIVQFWLQGGYRREGLHWLSALLALAPEPLDAASMAVRVTALEWAARLAGDGHDVAQAGVLGRTAEI